MILQEYLMKLGWNVDEPSFKKFLGAVSATGARTAELASTAIETAAAIELMVSRVARSYETLYYVSQRTGQSVKYIQSTQFAFKQIGLSADEANASIESIAATLRTQPWLRAIFGGATTPQQIAGNLGRSGLPYFLQVKFAEMIGMSEKTLFQLQKFSQVEADAKASFTKRQKEAGVNPEKLAAQSVIFGRELNKLESDLELFGDRMAADFIEPVTKGIVKLDEIVQWLNRADVATHGWISTLGALAGSVGGLWVFEKLLRRIFGASSGTAVGRLAAAGVGGVGALAGTAVGRLAAAGVGGVGALALGALALGGAGFGAASAINSKYGALYQGDTFNSKYLGGNQKERLQQTVEFFKQAGFPKEAAQGIAAGLFSESGLNPGATNPTSGAYGIAQHLGSRMSKFKDVIGQDIHGSSFEDQLKYVLWELARGGEQATGRALLQGGFKPSQGASMFVHGFERPGAAGEASDMRTAGPLADSLSGLLPQQSAGDTKNVTLQAKTDIHIAGSAGDLATIQGYKDAHNDVNDNLIRNLTARTR